MIFICGSVLNILQFVYFSTKVTFFLCLIFATDGFLEYWESRCLCSSHQAALTCFHLERFYLLEWLFLYQKAKMRTSWDANSSRTRISADLQTDVKRGRRSNRIKENQKVSNCYGNNIWPRISLGMVIGNLFCIVAYNN